MRSLLAKRAQGELLGEDADIRVTFCAENNVKFVRANEGPKVKHDQFCCRKEQDSSVHFSFLLCREEGPDFL
jgi:hypothetical protein